MESIELETAEAETEAETEAEAEAEIETASETAPETEPEAKPEARPPMDKRRRAARPEQITIAGEVYLRNDVFAAKLHCCEATLNGWDKEGMPFLRALGTKYRPETEAEDFLSGLVQRHKPKRARR
jgi:hypothetical protein